jgi:hypothetical protein
VPALAAIVGVSFAVRMGVAWLRAVPALFPDEYTYAALGRSIAESGRPLVRGSSPHFPALLQPIVTAPAWLVQDVGLAYRLVQTIGALAMSLAAIPVFLLARRLGLSSRVAVAAAALAVLVPDLVYASFVSSEALAYPLVLWAVYAGTCVVARPSRRGQVAFFVLVALATLARVQFAILPVVFLGAVVWLGLRERRVKAAVREQALPLLLFALPVLALVAAGPGRALGPYGAVLGFHGSALGIAKWGALDAMTLAYAAGWIVVPGALLGLWLALARPRTREETAFGAWVVLLTGMLLVEAGLLQTNVTLGKEIQERYVFYAVPLIGLCFALYAARGWPSRVPHLALAALLVLLSVRLPLSGYAIPATVDGSPILYAVYWLTGRLGEAGAASLVVAALAGALAGVAVLASRRPRIGTPVVIGLAMLATGAASAGAVAFDVTNTGLAKRAFLPRDPSWVDRAQVGRVSLLQAWGGIRAASLQELFWNRSVDRVLLLPGAFSIDRYGEERVSVAGDGSLRAGGQAVSGPLLVDRFGSSVQLRGARLVESGPTAALWVPAGRPRLALYWIGHYHDGWLADRGAVYLWPDQRGKALSGWLSMRLTVPRRAGKVKLTFRLPGGSATSVQVRPGKPERLNIQVCGSGRWTATFRSDLHGMIGLRAVSVQATEPVFRASPSACPEPEPVA